MEIKFDSKYSIKQRPDLDTGDTIIIKDTTTREKVAMIWSITGRLYVLDPKDGSIFLGNSNPLYKSDDIYDWYEARGRSITKVKATLVIDEVIS
jgi:hypothetical protein